MKIRSPNQCMDWSQHQEIWFWEWTLSVAALRPPFARISGSGMQTKHLKYVVLGSQHQYSSGAIQQHNFMNSGYSPRTPLYTLELVSDLDQDHSFYVLSHLIKNQNSTFVWISLPTTLTFKWFKCLSKLCLITKAFSQWLHLKSFSSFIGCIVWIFLTK